MTRMLYELQPWTVTLLTAHPQNEKKKCNRLVTQQPDIALNEVP